MNALIQPGPDDEPRRRHRLDLDAPFTRGMLRDAGISEATLRHLDYTQVMTGLWVLRSSINKDTMIRAALVLHPDDAFASHLSAAAVLGLPVPDHGFVHVMVRKHTDRRYRHGMKSHVSKRKRDVIVVRGIRTTTPIATFIDCAGWLSLVDRVILGDALCKKYKIKAAALRAACRASSHYYAGLALEAADLVRDGVDSPMETRLRLLIVFAGLPEPVVNFRIYNDDGTWKRRFDLCYPAIKLIIEYDGKWHLIDVNQRAKDLKRREEFDDEGYRILVVTSAGFFKTPLDTLERIHRQLIERGMPNVPAIGDGWKDHFAS